MARQNAVSNTVEPSGLPGVMKLVISSPMETESFLFNEKFSVQIQEERWYMKRRYNKSVQKIINVPICQVNSDYNIMKFFPNGEYSGGLVYFPRYLIQLHLPLVKIKSTSIRKCSYKLGCKYWNPGDYRDEWLLCSLYENPQQQWYSIGAAKEHLAFEKMRAERRAKATNFVEIKETEINEETPYRKLAEAELIEDNFEKQADLEEKEAIMKRRREWPGY